jgi:crotonobetainyl-CoA:carnitine CoA-transferase CaiB-like acyl-CoA transferase
MMSALSGVRVVDCTSELGAYGARLLASLGADVVRLVDARGGTAQPHGVYDMYFNAGKTVVAIDPNDGVQIAAVRRFAERAQIVIETVGASLLQAAGLTPERIAEVSPGAVHTRIAPLGTHGPDACQRASDLTLMARGGLMWLAGEPGRPPLRAAGHQSAIAVGLYAAVGSLIALLDAEATGRGQCVEVSGLEVIATALENAVQFWDLERTIRKRVGVRPREAGSGLFRCADGYVYLMAGRLSTPRGWVAIVDWLNEWMVPGAPVLQEPQWNEYGYRTTAAATEHFIEVIERFARGRRMVDLYEEGQRRGIVICPLNTPLDLLADRQLKHRRFFVQMDVNGTGYQVPRGPFLMSRTALAAPRPPLNRDVRAIEWPATRKAYSTKDRAHDRMPLSGIRVTDLTWVGAGPFATKILADHGAEVIKIESAGRLDALRTMPPYRDGKPGANRSGYFADRNTSKKSVTLNLNHPRGVELARHLISRSDVVANSFAAGTMEKWGLGYADCCALREDIIYLSMPMHGGDGPHGRFLGYGAAMSALSGLYAATGYAEGPPTGTGTNYPDHVPNPCHAAVALLAAIRHRRQTGRGQSIELSQVESTICAVGPLVLAAQEGPAEAARRHANREPGVAPHGVYPASGDDRWIAIACWNDLDWAALSRLSKAGWEDDPRFATLPLRLANEEALDDAVGRWTAHWEPFVLAARLQEAGIDSAPVQHAQDVVERDVQLRHARHWVRLRHPEMGDCLYNAPPFRLSATAGGLRSPAPLLGEHTDEVLSSVLHLAADEIAELRAAGVLA